MLQHVLNWSMLIKVGLHNRQRRAETLHCQCAMHFLSLWLHVWRSLHVVNENLKAVLCMARKIPTGTTNVSTDNHVNQASQQ